MTDSDAAGLSRIFRVVTRVQPKQRPSTRVIAARVTRKISRGASRGFTFLLQSSEPQRPSPRARRDQRGCGAGPKRALGVALPAITAAEAAILAERFMAELGQLPSQGKINIEIDPRR